MRRFAMCLDGTWNNAAAEQERDDGSRVYRPSNVLKLARAIEKTADQITYYDAGVGAMNRAPDARAKAIRFLDNKLGGAWGAGFEVNIEEAYSFLANNYSAGDEVFIFGFSRGAAQARSLCHLIEWVGGVPNKSDVYYIPKLFSGYLESEGEGSAQGIIERINERRAERGQDPIPPMIPVKISFLGVWDTVLALGSRLKARGGTTGKAAGFHTSKELPRSIGAIRHALAIDERRHDFQPEVWEPGSRSGVLEQRWFAGVHSNVGGGLIDDSLANCALRWIVDEAAACGLSVDRSFLEFFSEYPEGWSSAKSRGFKVMDTLLRPFRGFEGIRKMVEAKGSTLDRAVIARLNAKPGQHEALKRAYRPKNLRAYLAGNRDYDGDLSAEVLKWVEKKR